MSAASALSMASHTEELSQVVALNEASKSLLRHSLEINLHALNAIVQSKQSGERLRGFDEVCGQIRGWSRQLHAQLEALGGLGRDAVLTASGFLRHRRIVALLAAAAAETRRPEIATVVKDAQAALCARQEALRLLWRRIVEAVDDLKQLALMASVLSRSGMIEATAAESAERARLEEVAHDFYVKSEQVVGIVRLLGKSMRDVTP